MTDELNALLSAIYDCLSDFAHSGFDKARADKLKDSLKCCSDPYLERIRSTLGCSDHELLTIVLCLLVSLSGKAAQTASSLCGAPCGSVTPSLSCAMLSGLEDITPFIGSLQLYSPLSLLLEGVSPDYNAELRLKPFVSDYIVSGRLYDEAFLSPEESEKEFIPLASQINAANEIAKYISGLDRSEPFVLQVTGGSGTGRHTCAKAALGTLGIPWVCVKLNDNMSVERIRELSAKLLLSGGIALIGTDSSTRGFFDAVKLIAGETGLAILIGEHPAGSELNSIDTVTVRLEMPTLREQLLLWQNECRELELSEDVQLSEISGEFDMSPGSIHRAAVFSSALADNGRLTAADIKKGCYSSFDSDMGGKAVKLSYKFSWKDIVLSEQSRRLLADACSQVRMKHKVLDQWGFGEKLPYGRGVSMIFTGPPGTGKTMGAQVMAAELGMDIYKISLANVVSKYIGETEKNLNEIFEKAKLCQGILFFDEADVLFSKRTEVKDSNDKYSNMESAFLLQKMEEYNGVVILATNFVQNFDEAFKRRMRFIIDFPFPDVSLRRELWRKAFPEKAPLDHIDFDYLVERFELSGSNIKNIALHSAYLAAGDGSRSIGMTHIMEALRNEYAKSGKAFTKAEAGEYYFELMRQGKEE